MISDFTYEVIKSAIPNIEGKTLLDYFEDGFDIQGDNRFSTYDINLSPWVRVLCEWWDNPEIEWIYLIQASQTGKTVFCMGALQYVSRYSIGPAPVFWVQSTEDEARQFIQNRLRPFLSSEEKELIKNKKRYMESQIAFRVGKSLVKVGYGTSLKTLRSMPAKYFFGDEFGVWTVPTSYLKKRVRTYKGERKGVLATTPPFDESHHSWQEATAGDFYRWYVPCPECGHFQPLIFHQIKFEQCKNDDDSWDLDRTEEEARYQCEKCQTLIGENQKYRMISQGKVQCVDPKDDYKPCESKNSKSRTLQISSLYAPSVFMTWGQVARSFLEAKAEGIESLKIFCTDELAEPPKEMGKSLKYGDIQALVDSGRRRGERPSETRFLTCGVDVQRLGELYWTVIAWIPETIFPSGHMVDYGIVRWLDLDNSPNFAALQKVLMPYINDLWSIVLDSSDGEVARTIYGFCNHAGKQYRPLKEVPTQAIEVQYKRVDVDPVTKQRLAFGTQLMEVNSHMIKDQISTSLRQDPGSPGCWSFPADTEELYFRHMSNEHRTEEKRGNKIFSVWKPKYHGAPQHYFSSFVYGVAAMYEYRRYLIKMNTPSGVVTNSQSPRKYWIKDYRGWNNGE